ncbi:RidA family protein [Rhodococcus sp. NPDC057014]|uniref:RidA family protein n=1 Tax=Rhodococcus sp. NPDC057014 TaxID=3346000 RepID=UPI00363F8BD6
MVNLRTMEVNPQSKERNVTTHRVQVNSDEVTSPRGHFSHAVRAGNTVYVSGMLASHSDGTVLHPNDVAGQTNVIFTRLGQILTAAGGHISDVVSLTTYVTSIADRGPVNELRKEVFGECRPASTLVEVSALAAPGSVIEIDAIAVLSTSPR